MAPAPETLSKDFLDIIDSMWQEKSDLYIASPKEFIREVNQLFGEDKSFLSLHTSKVLPGYLVAARCMIQNELTSEYFPLMCTVRKGSEVKQVSGCFRDSLGADVTDIVISGKHGARNSYKVVLVPGAVDWWLNDFVQAHTTALCNVNEGSTNESTDPPPFKVSEFVVKVFDIGFPLFKPNTVVDIHGYLASPVNLDADDASSKRLKVHALRIREVNHVIPQISPPPVIDRRSIRSDLVKDISSVLGSTTNADIFVNFLVSRTYSRPPGGPPLCFMPLNIVGVEDSQAVNSIIEMIQDLKPKVKVLTLTPGFLSEKRFAPCKDYVSDDLVQGELQLSSGTVVVIDETQLPCDPFIVSGFVEENLKVLEDLIVHQKMEYNYIFYKIPMNVDYNIVILSKKKSKLFETPFRIPLQSPGALLPISHLQEKRIFLQQCRSEVSSISITDDISKKIQDNFVTMCSSLSGTVDKAALLNEMLIMSRLIACSNGSPCLEFEHWEHAVQISSANSSAMDSWRSQ